MSKIADQAGSTGHLMSPFGLYTLLSLLATGLSAECRFQFELILKRVFDDGQLDNQLSLLIDTLLSPSFCMATFLLVDKRLSLNATFVERAKSLFHAEIGVFDASMPAMPVSIASTRTGNLACAGAEHLINKAGLAADRPLMLMNVVQLRARWQQVFPLQLTTDGVFFIEDENTQEPPSRRVPMMRLLARLPYIKHNTFTSIDLCLHRPSATEDKDSEHSGCGLCHYVMTVLLPDNSSSLRYLEQHLSWPTIFSRQPGERAKPFVDLRLPRINMTATLSLDNVLQGMGVEKIFAPSASEEATVENRFSGMFMTSFEQNRFLDPPIVQHVLIDVNEAGLGTNPLRAAASEMNVTSSRHHSEAILVNVNRPFRFFVWHPETQLVLLAGAVRSPA